ncbi:hypothetical protein HYH03_016090 [Edaphochlamys debaryana]|uniref:Uncharacterized protein n=1 Tax=Edaphochlamys debaryana TaxID=47281 RepID=A0A836BQA2_9CHLO|nr:hypothetical protein HYH03_016090 [Edaphochlamys debaryana]|eukprot:KAG2485201.1 hypothetical protein HYH03_016090 [Edaphochlamys debaryana]
MAVSEGEGSGGGGTTETAAAPGHAGNGSSGGGAETAKEPGQQPVAKWRKGAAGAAEGGSKAVALSAEQLTQFSQLWESHNSSATLHAESLLTAVKSAGINIPKTRLAATLAACGLAWRKPTDRQVKTLQQLWQEHRGDPGAAEKIAAALPGHWQPSQIEVMVRKHCTSEDEDSEAGDARALEAAAAPATAVPVAAVVEAFQPPVVHLPVAVVHTAAPAEAAAAAAAGLGMAGMDGGAGAAGPAEGPADAVAAAAAAARAPALLGADMGLDLRGVVPSLDNAAVMFAEDRVGGVLGSPPNLADLLGSPTTPAAAAAAAAHAAALLAANGTNLTYPLSYTELLQQGAGGTDASMPGQAQGPPSPPQAQAQQQQQPPQAHAGAQVPPLAVLPLQQPPAPLPQAQVQHQAPGLVAHQPLQQPPPPLPQAQVQAQTFPQFRGLLARKILFPPERGGRRRKPPTGRGIINCLQQAIEAGEAAGQGGAGRGGPGRGRGAGGRGVLGRGAGAGGRGGVGQGGGADVVEMELPGEEEADALQAAGPMQPAEAHLEAYKNSYFSEHFKPTSAVGEEITTIHGQGDIILFGQTNRSSQLKIAVHGPSGFGMSVDTQQELARFLSVFLRVPDLRESLLSRV